MPYYITGGKIIENSPLGLMNPSSSSFGLDIGAGCDTGTRQSGDVGKTTQHLVHSLGLACSIKAGKTRNVMERDQGFENG